MPALELRLSRHARPASFHWRRRWHTVVSIEKTWQIQTAWWRGDDERTDRHSLEVTAREGLRCVLMHDRIADARYQASIDD